MITPAAFLVILLAAPAMESGTVRSKDGVAVHYVAQGRGEPALVFVHGFGIDGSYWRHAMEALAPSRRVVALDLPGHGKSGADRKDWTMAAFGEDVRAVADHLKLGKVVLLGHSMSGNVVLEAARLLGDRVAGVVPVDTLLDPDQTVSEPEIAGAIAGFKADYPGTARAFGEKYMFVAATPQAVKDRVVKDWTARNPVAAAATLENTWRYDPRPAITAVRAPIVAVNADQYPTNLVAWRKYAPRFEAVIVRGTGHYPMLEKPAEFVAALKEAVAKVEAARGGRP
jgi:pimeloyl-ACP methyl ester carboxylesterase